MIAGKSRQDALQLLSTRKDIQNVVIETFGGFGSAMPTAFENIKLVVVTKLSGEQKTSVFSELLTQEMRQNGHFMV